MACLQRIARFFVFPLASAALTLSLLTPSPALGAESKTKKAIAQRTALLKKSDWQGLEALAASLKGQPLKVEETYPPLKAFHSTDFKALKGEQYHAYREQLEDWIEAIPQSVTAKVLLVDWWVDYGWQARGTGWAKEVTEEGWKLMGERLIKAKEILLSIPEEKVDDPEYYRLAILLAAAKESSVPNMIAILSKARERWPEYYPLYQTATYFMLPKWLGTEASWLSFVTQQADAFPGEKGDLLYANLLLTKTGSFNDELYQSKGIEYPRIVRGYAYAKKHAVSNLWSIRNNLCYLAANRGDHDLARQLFLSLYPKERVQSFGKDKETMLRFRNECGAQAVIDAAAALEHAGSLDEAEKAYLAFSDEPAENESLARFYLRHGQAEKFIALTGEKEINADLTTASINTLATIATTAPMLGAWEQAEEAAQRFDSKRPWNLLGRATLFVAAARKGDREAAEALRKKTLEFSSNRPAYKALQAVISGSKEWSEVAPTLTRGDGYTEQATITLIGYYLAFGEHEKAEEVLRISLPAPQTHRDLAVYVESFSYGSLAPMIKK